MRLIDEGKKNMSDALTYFKLRCYTLILKKYKNTACKDFVSVSITLNLVLYEKN